MSIDPTWLAAFLRAESLPADFAAEIERLHAPLAARIAAVAMGPAFVVGICGPQGSGKSTTVRVVAALLEARGLRVATLSLDDLYLPRSDREALARDVHPLLRTRGVPGTHDVALGLAALDSLADAGETALPRFDKATDDRAPRPTWPVVAGPVDVVLFEGWCVGARPEPAARPCAAPINALERERDRGRNLAGPCQRRPGRALSRPVRPPGPADAVHSRRTSRRCSPGDSSRSAKLRARLAPPTGQGGAMSDDQVADLRPAL
jgi:D-glycerate 3-kinase